MLDTRYRKVEAVSNNYLAVCMPFQMATDNSPCVQMALQSKHSVFTLLFSSHAFVNSLGIMCDALQELSGCHLSFKKEKVSSFWHTRQFVGNLRPCRSGIARGKSRITLSQVSHWTEQNPTEHITKCSFSYDWLRI